MVLSLDKGTRATISPAPKEQSLEGSLSSASPREHLQKAIAKAAETPLSDILRKHPGILINLDGIPKTSDLPRMTPTKEPAHGGSATETIRELIRKYPGADINTDFPGFQDGRITHAVLKPSIIDPKFFPPAPEQQDGRNTLAVFKSHIIDPKILSAVDVARKNPALENAVALVKKTLDAGNTEVGIELVKRVVEPMLAQDPIVKKAYEGYKQAHSAYEKLESELAKKNFPEAKPARYDSVAGTLVPVYPTRTADGGFVHTIDGKAVVVDQKTHERIEKTSQARTEAVQKFETVSDEKIRELGLDTYNQKYGLILNLWNAAQAEYEKSHLSA